MMTRPFISIILPCYNSEKTLNRCIDSILSQTFQDFELVAVNDGSTDGSLEILRNYSGLDNRIRIIDKRNGGVSSARNAALDEARGEWIAFCDSDDYVEPEWLENFISISSGVDLALQGIIYECSGPKTSLHLLQSIYGDTPASKRELITTLISNGVLGYLFTKLFRHSIIDKNRIRFNTESHFREDEEFFSTYLLYVKSWQSSDSVAYHYFLPDGNKKYKGFSYRSLVPIFKNLDAIFDGKYPAAIADIHSENIKGMITIKCYNGEIPTEYECDLYNRLVQYKSRLHGYALIDRFITASHKKRSSRHALIIMHAISKLIKHLK